MIKVSFLMDGSLYDEAFNIVKSIITDRRGFGYYPSLIVESIKVEEVEDNKKESID